MEQAEREARMDSVLLASDLREAAAKAQARGDEAAEKTMLDAAATIEGHVEAFGVLVDKNRELEAELKHTRQNHRHTLDFIGRWRELLIAMQAEHPNDIRLKRALAGEHPMRPAAWERPRSNQ